MALCLGLVAHAWAFPITVTDDRGSEIAIESRPERIVAIGALYAQIVVDLGAVDRLVAVGETADNPSEVLSLPSAGPTYAPNVEIILGFEPDLVLGATDWGGERPALEAAGVTVLSTPWLTSVPSLFDTIRTIGAAIGSDQEAAALIGQIATEIVEAEAIAIGKPAVKAAFLYASSPDDPPYAAGSDAIEHELILRAGGLNVFSELQWTPQVSFEEIIARDPEVIFTAPSQVANVVNHPLLQDVTAVATGRVIGIRASVVASTQVADALHSIIEALHDSSP
jgi:iron complex transport system substrate-binding protein